MSNALKLGIVTVKLALVQLNRQKEMSPKIVPVKTMA